MALQVRPSDLKAAARVAGLMKQTRPVSGRRSPWSKVHRIRSDGGQLRLYTTDGAIFLEWSIPARGEDTFDMLVDAAAFNALGARLADDGAYEVSRSEGLLLMKERRQLRLAECPPVAYPPSPQPDGPGTPEDSTVTWSASAVQLARALEFIIPFISATDPNAPRSVATWTSVGILIGGTPKRAGLVRGLPPPAAPLSFRKATASATAAFLSRLRGNVEIRVDGTRYTFSCPAAGHRLSVPGESTHLSEYLLRSTDEGCETFLVDRKTFLASVEILSVFLTSSSHRFEFRVRGRGQDASIRLSTPEAEPARSTDEFAIIRHAGGSGDALAARDANPSTCGPDTCFSIPGASLREVLGAMEVVTLCCRYDGPHRRIIIEEAPIEGRGSRAVILSVGRENQVREESAVPPGPLIDEALELPRSLAQGAPLSA